MGRRALAGTDRDCGARIAGRLSAGLLLCLLALPFGALGAEGGEGALLPGAGGTTGFGAQPDFLKVDEAFRSTTEVRDGELRVRWEIEPGYYLYRHRLGFDSRDGLTIGAPSIPDGKAKYDEYFGDVEVYYQGLDVQVPLAAGAAPGQLEVEYQGCADAGLCYPPERKTFSVDPGNPGILLPAAKTRRGGAAAPASTTASGEGGRLTRLLEEGAILPIMALFLLAGIGLAFTPCVLPMVPILSSIIVGRSAGATTSGASPGRMRGFNLSMVYVSGMAITYALLGVLVGYFGAEFNLQAKLQAPALIVLFSALFIALAMAMFGWYELQLPAFLRDPLDRLSARQQGGEYASVAVMGVLSSLVVSPCVSAPLAGALVYISTTGDALLGGVALLALGFGMGIPLIIIGTSGGTLLPRAGAWMEGVKALFGFGLLGVAIWMMERIIPGALTMVLWGSLAAGVVWWYGRDGFLLGDRSPAKIRTLGVSLAGAWGALLFVGAATGSHDPLRPWEHLVDDPTRSEVRFTRVGDLAELESALAAARGDGQPVLFDFYADWCISCKVMERNVFTDAEVAGEMSRFMLLQIDVTDNNDVHQQILSRYDLFGPPSILFFDTSGSEMRGFRIQGEMTRDEFLSHLQSIRNSVAVR